MECVGDRNCYTWEDRAAEDTGLLQIVYVIKLY